MKKTLILLISISILWSCASQKPAEKEIKTVRKIEIMSLPAWAYEIPSSGDFAIGIAARSFYEDQMKDAAKQMAAIIHSRNKASYTITKAAATDKEEYQAGGSAQFRLNVSSSPQETQRIYNSLKLVDEVYYHEFYLGLYSEKATEIGESFKKQYVANFPAWFNSEGLMVDSGIIRCYAAESSSNLVTAWEKAAEKARFEIARYYEKNVQTALINENEDITKKIAVETRLKLAELQISRSYITSELADNLRSYKVYLEVIAKQTP